MRNLTLLILIVLIGSCSSQKTASRNSSTSELKTQKQGSKMYGKVVVKSVLQEGKEVPFYYFDIQGVEYLIKYAFGKVTKSDIQKYQYKDIDVLGELGMGIIGTSETKKSIGIETSGGEEERIIIIYEILN
jgi:hypothetical protein